VLIVPISIARFASYAGARVPDAFTFLADVIYALGGPSPLTINPSDLMADGCHHNLGVANLVHYLNTRRSMPDISTMPHFSTPRSRLDKEDRFGITPFRPFTLTSGDTEDKPGMMTGVPGREVAVS
jgi:hypothetical protein